MILASIRVLGTAAPASATAWLDRLRTLANEVFAARLRRRRPRSLAARPAPCELRDPLGFGFAIDPTQLRPGRDRQPDADRPGDPDRADPTDAPRRHRRRCRPRSRPARLDATRCPSIAWPADDTVVDGRPRPTSRAAGYRTTCVVSSTQRVGDRRPATVDLGGIRRHRRRRRRHLACVRDAVVLQRPTRPAGRARPRRLGARAGWPPSRPGAPSSPPSTADWPFGDPEPRTRCSHDLAAQTRRSTVGLTTVLDGAHPAADASSTSRGRRAPRPAQLDSRGRRGRRASAVRARSPPTPLPLTAPRRLALLALLAVSWLRGTDDWAAARRPRSSPTRRRSSTRCRSCAAATARRSVRSDRLPVTVSNALARAGHGATSNVDSPQLGAAGASAERAAHRRAGLVEQGRDPGAGASPTARSSRARHAAAARPGVPIGSPDFVKVDLQAGWESVGTVIVVILLVLIFGGGIVRNIVKRRRRARALGGRRRDRLRRLTPRHCRRRADRSRLAPRGCPPHAAAAASAGPAPCSPRAPSSRACSASSARPCSPGRSARRTRAPTRSPSRTSCRTTSTRSSRAAC